MQKNNVINLFQDEQTFEYGLGSITIKSVKKELLFSDAITMLEMVKHELMAMMYKEEIED